MQPMERNGALANSSPGPVFQMQADAKVAAAGMSNGRLGGNLMSTNWLR